MMHEFPYKYKFQQENIAAEQRVAQRVNYYCGFDSRWDMNYFHFFVLSLDFLLQLIPPLNNISSIECKVGIVYIHNACLIFLKYRQNIKKKSFMK